MYIFNLLKSQKVKSVLFLTRFYKTQRYKLSFNRLSEETNIHIYVEPAFKLYKHKLDRWWEKTTYANYFLSEYIRMFNFYFNKLLWIEY